MCQSRAEKVSKQYSALWFHDPPQNWGGLCARPAMPQPTPISWATPANCRTGLSFLDLTTGRRDVGRLVRGRRSPRRLVSLTELCVCVDQVLTSRCNMLFQKVKYLRASRPYAPCFLPRSGCSRIGRSSRCIQGRRKWLRIWISIHLYLNIRMHPSPRCCTAKSSKKRES